MKACRELTGGFGLLAMRQRIEGLSGTLQVESEPGAGTAISACVPVVPGRAAERACDRAPWIDGPIPSCGTRLSGMFASARDFTVLGEETATVPRPYGSPRRSGPT